MNNTYCMLQSCHNSRYNLCPSQCDIFVLAPTAGGEKETITVYFLPERSLNYRFSSGRSQYVVVTDVSLSYGAANKKCSRILGPGANLVNVTTEEEYIVINGALNAMDIEGSTMFWIAGYVNQPYKSFHKWGFCEPGCNLLLFLPLI